MKTWIEKYRPTSIEELELDSSVRRQLESFEVETLPHLIITGVPGTGKTSTALILAKRLIRNKDAYIELNASDNRGILMITALTNNFIRRQTEDKRKVIILDEADNITKKAQEQLINLMECYPNVRCIMTCNEISNLIEGLQSRCMLLSFKRLTTIELKKKLYSILKQENVTVESDEVIELIIRQSDRDIRCCLNYLQTLADIKSDRHITMDELLSAFRIPSLNVIEDWLRNSLTIDLLLENYYSLLQNGFCNNDLLNMIICYYERLLNELIYDVSTDIISRRRLYMEILKITHNTHFKMVQTTDDELLMIQHLFQIFQLITDMRL